VRRGGDLEENEVIATFTGFIDPEVDLWVEVGYEPILQLLALHPAGTWAKRRSDESVSRVVDSPYEIGLWFAQECSDIREG